MAKNFRKLEAKMSREARRRSDAKARRLLAEERKRQRAGSPVTNEGRVTVPKTIREHLGLKTGDRVKFFVHPNGSVVLLPVRPLKALRGMLKSKRRRPVSIEEMNEAIAEGASGVKRAILE